MTNVLLYNKLHITYTATVQLTMVIRGTFNAKWPIKWTYLHKKETTLLYWITFLIKSKCPWYWANPQNWILSESCKNCIFLPKNIYLFGVSNKVFCLFVCFKLCLITLFQHMLLSDDIFLRKSLEYFKLHTIASCSN